jgi:glycosyltransferase involved in cell wall biosynthesis
LPFEHEIIISDDNSIDGTWEVAQNYASRYNQIRAYSCNTTKYHPITPSDRCGWNKCNAYQYATGKYIAHVDGDDFFLNGKDIYKKQVELLEQNPSCSYDTTNKYDQECTDRSKEIA